jgi:FAD/FMN-containing dehydrogenase
MTASRALLAELGAAAGAGGAVRYGTEVAGFAVCGVAPLAVAEPAGAEEVARVLAVCTAAGVPVEPAGAGTWLSSGRPPPAASPVRRHQ